MNSNKTIIVFDIGGTWFRSGIYINNKVLYLTKKPAINYKNTEFRSMKGLQNKFIKYIKNEVIVLENKLGNKKTPYVAISMGAALNGHTGNIFNSGPLWGPDCKEFNLKEKLEEILPDMQISIINDVSAALLREVQSIKNTFQSKVMLITVSTGIACRVYDAKNKNIPIDKIYGLQGEIGHLVIRFDHKGNNIDLFCDCGGKNHMNAFCSGRGIEQVLKIIDNEILLKDFVNNVKNSDKAAISILNSVTKPIADLLITAITLDPTIEKIILTGGVVSSLDKFYLTSLLSNISAIGMYQITTRDENFFKKRIILGKNDDISCLIGAGLSFNYNI